jgi:hypothetical protein
MVPVEEAFAVPLPALPVASGKAGGGAAVASPATSADIITICGMRDEITVRGRNQGVSWVRQAVVGRRGGRG